MLHILRADKVVFPVVPNAPDEVREVLLEEAFERRPRYRVDTVEAQGAQGVPDFFVYM
jgi:hypothetical protein